MLAMANMGLQEAVLKCPVCDSMSSICYWLTTASRHNYPTVTNIKRITKFGTDFIRCPGYPLHEHLPHLGVAAGLRRCLREGLVEAITSVVGSDQG